MPIQDTDLSYFDLQFKMGKEAFVWNKQNRPVMRNTQQVVGCFPFGERIFASRLFSGTANIVGHGEKVK